MIKTNNFNKISTKEEMLKLLYNYKEIFSSNIYNYLYSLIDLEYSAINNNIDINIIDALSNIELYKKIVIYNIYNRALLLAKKIQEELLIKNNKDNLEGIILYCENKDKKIKLYEFNYEDINRKKTNVSSEYKTKHIGNIILHKTIYDKELREKELLLTNCKLQELYNSNNNYYNEYNNYIKIKEYEEYTTKLKNELTTNNLFEIATTEKIYNLFLKEYNLSESDFTYMPNQKEKYGNNILVLNKKIASKNPIINIKSNIKYI